MHGSLPALSQIEDPLSGYPGKRCFDIVVSGLLIVLSSPLFVVAMLLVWLSGSGPLFFHQEREGRDRKTFICWKFRTLYMNTERPDDVVEENDERLIPFGRFLRATHIDELPQLFHVLRGEMSMVGRRPDTPEKARLRRESDPLYPRIQSSRPGMAGLVALCGKRELLERNDPDFCATALELKYLMSVQGKLISGVLTDLFIVLCNVYKALAKVLWYSFAPKHIEQGSESAA